jgi:hypothetical protein
MRTTPENITQLNANEIFVFGSNLSGYHAGGAARTAMKWGAQWGQEKGLQGQTYAIPTKDYILKTLPIEKIKPFVDGFIIFAKKNQNLTFLITEIGCGLAGYEPKDIAPLFIDAVNINNIYLPKRFWDIISANAGKKL